MNEKIEINDLSSFYESELNRNGYLENLPNPKIVFDVFCDAFSWKFNGNSQPESFLIETIMNSTNYKTKEKCAYVGFTIQFMIINFETETTDLIRVGTEFEFSHGEFPKLGNNTWFMSSLEYIKKNIMSNKHFQKMLQSKPIQAIHHLDEG